MTVAVRFVPWKPKPNHRRNLLSSASDPILAIASAPEKPMAATQKEIELTPVADSKAFKAHGYDPETQTMRVQFINGSVHDHDGVSPEKYAAFTGAHSMGGFYNAKIKPHHQSRKVG